MEFKGYLESEYLRKELECTIMFTMGFSNSNPIPWMHVSFFHYTWLILSGTQKIQGRSS